MDKKKQYIDLLRQTKRNNIDSLIAVMEINGFFDAPCSGQYHLCVKGGLLEHSLNVHNIALMLNNTLQTNIPDSSITIAALLHDLGKMGDRGKANYTENWVQSKKKVDGEYPLVQSEAKPYITNPDLKYIDHEIRSVMIAERYIELTEEEEFAILYHNGMYGNLKYAISGKETPLYLIIHFADMWASRIVEVKK